MRCSKGNISVLFLLALLVGFIAIGTLLFIKNRIQIPTNELTKKQDSVSSYKNSSEPTVENYNGATLTEIKYDIPNTWTSKFENDKLWLAPMSNGGFLAIKIYSYSNTVDEKAYYCQISGYCIDDVTYFKEITIGNISGYSASALDNSGGGTEYFGAKGDKFYVISSYNPPSPNEFEKDYQNVFDSLVF